jgi:hypothetical protein
MTIATGALQATNVMFRNAEGLQQLREPGRQQNKGKYFEGRQGGESQAADDQLEGIEAHGEAVQVEVAEVRVGVDIARVQHQRADERRDSGD